MSINTTKEILNQYYQNNILDTKTNGDDDQQLYNPVTNREGVNWLNIALQCLLVMRDLNRIINSILEYLITVLENISLAPNIKKH